MSMIRVTSEDLQSTSAQLLSGAQEIDSRLAGMRTQIQTLVSADWQGAASTQFNTLYDQWNTSAGQLNQALDGIAKMLANAASAYQQTEQQITQSMQG